MKKEDHDIRANLVVYIAQMIADNSRIESGAVELAADALRKYELVLDQMVRGLRAQGTPVRLQIPPEALQIGAHFSRALVAEIAVLLQRLVDDVFQLGWHVGIQPQRWRRYRIQNGFEDESGAFPTERQPACSHLVQHCAKGEQIRSRV